LGFGVQDETAHLDGGTMLSLVWTIIIGFIAGAVAKLLMPGKDPGGFLITTGLGVAGALVATFLGRLIGWYGEGESAGFVAAVVGAVIVLLVYRFIKSKQAAK
jgi:uncharacterized membrane protein YeaQ/YmgE (transglycosylase-associated protein family)